MNEVEHFEKTFGVVILDRKEFEARMAEMKKVSQINEALLFETKRLKHSIGYYKSFYEYERKQHDKTRKMRDKYQVIHIQKALGENE